VASAVGTQGGRMKLYQFFIILKVPVPHQIELFLEKVSKGSEQLRAE